MRYLILTLLFTLPLHAQSPTADDFKAELAKLDAKSSKEDRIGVTKWIAAKAESEHASLAIAPLEKLIRKDAEEEVRRAAMKARFQIARKRNEPCPLAIVEALRDPVDMVRYEASMWAGLFKTRYTEGSVKLLVEALSDKRAEVRSDCLYHLGSAGEKDPKALAAIEEAKKDNVFSVRLSAYMARYRITNNLDEYLTFMIRLRVDPSGLLDTLPEGSEEANVQLGTRNFFVLDSAGTIAAWSENRPEELAKCLVKLLDDKSWAIRLGAAESLGLSARKTHPFEHLRPFVHPDSKEKFLELVPTEKNTSTTLLPSKAYQKFREYKAERSLRYLSTMDENTGVRAAAKLALQRFAELPEPLTVVPREVKR